jgi:hypothetical protein
MILQVDSGAKLRTFIQSSKQTNEKSSEKSVPFHEKFVSLQRQ